MRGTAICVADGWAAADYIRALAEGWLSKPPDFDWRLVSSERIRLAFGDRLPASRFVAGNADLVADVRVAADRPGPKVVVVSAGGMQAELDVVSWARSLALPVFQYVDTWYGYRRRMQSDGRLVLGDRVLVIDGHAAAEAAEEGLPADILVAVGHPVWERIGPLAPSQKRRTLFVGAPVRRDYGMKLGYTEIEAWDMLKQVIDASPDLAGEICYAPHPDDASPLRIDGVQVVKYRAEMLLSVDTVAGMFSAPLVDAYLSRRRAITLQPQALGYDMCPLSRHGRIPRVTAAAELAAALRAEPPDPRNLAADLMHSGARITAEIEKALLA